MNLKELRNKKKLTQSEASLLVSIPLRSYKRLEGDKKYLSSYKYQRAFELIKNYKRVENSLSKKNISVVGIGYVGLSNAIILAQHNKVYALDIDYLKLDTLSKKKSPFVDKEIDKYLREKRLELITTVDNEEAYINSDYVIIATPTNYNSEFNKFDTSSVECVIQDVKRINPKAWIVIKSTVGVGFTSYIKEKLGYKRILFSPEFLREGKALYDNLYPSRIVVGIPEKNNHYIKKAKEFAKLLEQGAFKENIDIHIIGSTEAEAVKLFANTYLALRVAYFNELDSFAQSKKLNSIDIIKGVCGDYRIGDYYNNPSFGFGGYCLPKDIKELKENFNNVPEELISAIIRSNETRKDFIVKEIMSIIKKDDVVGIYRLSMKYDSDNFRSSSVIDIINRLVYNKTKVIIYEPTLKDGDTIFGSVIVNKLDEFKKQVSLIIANRYNSELNNVRDKVYTRDIFNRD